MLLPHCDPYNHFGLTLNPDEIITHDCNTPMVEANLEPIPGKSTVSKYITINEENHVWVQIYRLTKLPSNDNTVARQSIVFFFPTDRFILLDPANLGMHGNCVQLAGEVPTIVVFVACRHAPKSRLPTQYYDARDAILWVRKQITDPNGEQWLRDYGDLSRCYLYGCGSGGNIMFNTAMLVADMESEPVRICGVIMNQPMLESQ